MGRLGRYIRVGWTSLAVGLSFLAVWLLSWRLTGYAVAYRCFIYALIIPFALPFIEKWTKPNDLRMRIWSVVLAVLFAVCSTIGFSIYKTHSLSLCLDSPALIAVSLLKIAVYTYVSYKVIVCLFSNVIWFADRRPEIIEEKFLPIKNIWLFCFIAICRLPFLVVLYPCLFDYDAAVSLSSFGEGRILNNHHPFLVACLQKAFFEIGRLLGNPSVGFALFSILFIILVSALLVYTVRFCGRMGVSVFLQKVLVAFYALMPFFSLLNIYDTKDGIFAYSILFFVTTLADILWRFKKGEKPLARLIVMHGLAVFLVCFSRPQGIYLVLAQYLLLALVCRRWFLRLSAAYLPGIVVYYLVVKLLYPFIGVVPGGKQEMYGVMFQQSALCMITHPDQISEEEKRAFTALIEVDPDTLDRCFDYSISDPVKSLYRYKPLIEWSIKNNYSEAEEKEALSDYTKSWLTTFSRHPGTCALASMNLINGFFYNTGCIFIIEPWKLCPYFLREYDFYCRMSPYYFYVDMVPKTLSKAPLLEFVFAKAYYTWLYIFLFVVFVYRRDTMGITTFASLFLTVGLFFICPTSSFRYSLPLVACAAIIILYSTHANGKERQKHSSSDTMLQ